MSDNPLKRYFRQPAIYLKLPTNGRWYDPSEVTFNSEGEIAIYGLSAIDDVMLNTPDAMLNGQALENVIKNCAPDIKNVKKLMVPDLEALFLGMKIGTTGSKYDIDRRCPKCGHENTFEINCEHVLSNVSHVEDSDTVVTFNDELEVNVRPYTLEMRQQFIQRQFEENQLLKAVDDQNKDMGDFDKARIVGESIEKITRMTFNLVSKSIESIKLLKQNITVTDPAEISEWLVNISKSQADMVIETVNKLNEVGVPRSVPAACEKCQHEWTETLTFDPVSFFGKR